MNPIFIYQNEAKLDYNNKFTIDFIDNDYVNYIKFFQKNQYYISSLNCNITKANKKITSFKGSQSDIDKLSEKSRELLDKGAASKNDITYMTSFLTPNFNLPDVAPQKYKLVLNPEIINNNSFNYQFYDIKDKRLKFAKIYSPFSHFKNGFLFKGENDPNKNNKVLIRLIDDSKIRCIFLQSKNKQWKIEKNFYRDINTKFVKTQRSDGTNKWDSTHPKLFLLAEEKTLREKVFDTTSFMNQLYWDKHFVTEEKGKFPVIGTPLTSVFNSFTQPFIQTKLKVTLKNNRTFFIYGSPNARKHNIGFDSIIDDCWYQGETVLTENDKKEIEKNFPNFSFNSLSRYYTGPKDIITQWKQNDLLFPSATETASNSSNIFDPKTQFMKFVSENVKYKDYLDSNDGVFFLNRLKISPVT